MTARKGTSGRASVATIVGVGAALVVVALAFAVVSMGPDARDAKVVQAAVPAPPNDSGSNPDLVEIDRATADESGRRTKAPGARTRSVQSIPDWPLVPILGGRLVVIEPNGHRNRRASAMLDIATRSDDGWGHVRVPVVDGRWKLELATGFDGTLVDPQTLRVIGPANEDVHYQTMAPEMTDGGRAVVLVGDQSPALTHGLFDTVLRARRLTAAALVVVDAQTDLELDDVVVLIAPTRSQEHAGVRHPGSGREFSELDRGPSPIELREDRARRRFGTQRLLVGAEGYAWQKVGIDIALGGERRVALERGGTLEISTKGDLPRGAAIRLTRDGLSTPYASVEPTLGPPVVLEGVAPGKYTVSLEVGRWEPGGDALDAEEVNVEAGRRTRVTLESEVPPPPSKGRVAGTVRVPADWEPDTIDLKIVAVGTSGSASRLRWGKRQLPASGGSGGSVEYAFDCGEQPVGRYRLLVDTYPTAFEFDLDVDGRDDLVVDVAPPVEITVETVNASTGERVAAGYLTWRTPRVPGQRPFSAPTTVDRADPGEPFRIRVPRSEIELQVRDGEFVSARTRVVPVDGERIVLDVRRAIRVCLMLRDGETTIPWPLMEIKSVERTDGTACTAWYDFDARGAQVVRIHAPGLHRVEVPRVDGYEPREPFEFEVGDGASSDVFIDLVPAR